MPVSDQELRDLVREAIARQARAVGETSVRPAASGSYFPSHARLPVPPGSAGDGMCVIEPAVRCNHCGYCQSYGH